MSSISSGGAGSSSSLVPTESDRDGDGVPDDSDNCKHHSNRHQEDTDLDGVGNICDNCPYDHNPDQQNSDADFMGDECDCDDDNDGVGEIFHHNMCQSVF